MPVAGRWACVGAASGGAVGTLTGCGSGGCALGLLQRHADLPLRLVGPPRIAAVEHPGVLGQGVRRHQRLDLIRVADAARAAFEQRTQVDSDAGTGELSERAEQAGEAAAVVDRDRLMRALGQDLGRQPAQDRLRPDLEEDARAVLVHRLDLGDELDRPHQVLGHLLARLGDLGRMRAGGGVRVDRNAHRLPRRRFDQRRQLALRRLDQARNGRPRRPGSR